jgi:hypothetical protein
MMRVGGNITEPINSPAIKRNKQGSWQIRPPKSPTKNGGYLTNYAFHGFIAGRRGTAQTDEISALKCKDHVGLAVQVDLTNNTQKCRYVNTAGNTVPVYNPFVEGDAQSEFVPDLK